MKLKKFDQIIRAEVARINWLYFADTLPIGEIVCVNKLPKGKEWKNLEDAAGITVSEYTDTEILQLDVVFIKNNMLDFLELLGVTFSQIVAHELVHVAQVKRGQNPDHSKETFEKVLKRIEKFEPQWYGYDVDGYTISEA